MPNRAIAAFFLLTAACALLLGGCGTTRSFDYELDHPLLAQGMAIDVRNFRGSVDVRVDPNLDTILVETRLHVSPHVVREDVDEVLDAIDVSAEVVEQERFAVLQVRSTTARPLADDHAVQLLITMPRCDGVYIENAYGLVELVNVRGAIRVSNHKGAIEVRTKHQMSDPVTLTAVDGSIWYQIPAGSAGHLDLESMEGEVRFADKVQGTNQVHDVSLTTFDATLNGGTSPILARTNKGNITVLVLEDPVALTRAFHRPTPNWYKMVFQKGSHRYLRNLPDDHPEVRSDTRSGRAPGEAQPPPARPSD
jgi:hypothetical protein